jgi:hypothetical protein
VTVAAKPIGVDARAEVLRAHDAGDRELEELLAYTRNEFDTEDLPASFPLPDELHVATWARYVEESRAVGPAECLARRLVQLRFPVAAGTSERSSYKAATRRGIAPPLGECARTRFRDPDGLSLFLHPTPAGRIPVIVASVREDFVTLVCALTRRNEPAPIPESTGACIVAGYNNWDRIATLRRTWEEAHAERSEAAWTAAFREIVRQKELYQDRFILLSSGPYSAVVASDLGLAEATWRAMSLRIRLEHECAHYFTRRVFGAMRNALLDEVIADYAGIRAAAGRFRADWFLRFMGLEDAARFRASGRLANYRGEPPLSESAFAVLCSLVQSVAEAVEDFDRSWPARELSMSERAEAITALARAGIEGLAGRRGVPSTRVYASLHRGAPAV